MSFEWIVEDRMYYPLEMLERETEMGHYQVVDCFIVFMFVVWEMFEKIWNPNIYKLCTSQLSNRPATKRNSHKKKILALQERKISVGYWANDLTASIDISVLQERLTNMINLDRWFSWLDVNDLDSSTILVFLCGVFFKDLNKNTQICDKSKRSVKIQSFFFTYLTINTLFSLAPRFYKENEARNLVEISQKIGKFK
ncbi:Uncharacterized protein Fot_05541 [Forsythia ovata]|uniref:Uncharacterized protein n=1 Tax=Forsythia ovata TaxID=205694 RepID=A0ABD1WQE7_9LAMI